MDAKDIRNIQEAYLEVYVDLDEATRMRKELGKEGETATRKELASRSKAFKRSGSIDKTIAAAERAADWSDDEKKARTLRRLAASRRGSVRGEGGLRGYASKVEGGDKDLQSARGSARSAGTLTPAEKKKLGENIDVYDIVLSHLLDEGYVDTEEAAEVMMVNMSEEWIDSIVEAKYGTAQGRKRLAKKIRKGEDIGKKGPGTGFEAVKRAAKKGGAKDPAAVAAAAMWKTYAK